MRTRTVSQWVITAGLLAGFVGLAVLGIALISMAVTLPAGILNRVVVFILGVGGLLVGVGYVRIVRNR